MYASSCCSHPSLSLKRVITSSSPSRVITASLPAPLTFFLPLSSFAAHFWLRMPSFINSIPNTFQRASHWTTDNPEMNASAKNYWGEPQRAPQLRVDLDFRHSQYIYEPAHAKRGLMAIFVEFEISTVSDVELSQKYASENRFQKYQACTKLWSIK